MESDTLDDATFAEWANDLGSWVLAEAPSDKRVTALAELFSATAASGGWFRILTALADNIADCDDETCSRAQELELQIIKKYANLRAAELRKLADCFVELDKAEQAEDY